MKIPLPSRSGLHRHWRQLCHRRRLGSYYTNVYGINNVGQVVGNYNNASGAPDHGFQYSGGSYTTIDVPGAFATLLLGTNDSGQLVGAYRNIDDEPGTGFVSAVPLPTPATLPLFATGLGLMALLRWRRTRLRLNLTDISGGT
jgi:probable HAF family extracellular repeat protein